jgi:hypothetical protein
MRWSPLLRRRLDQINNALIQKDFQVLKTLLMLSRWAKIEFHGKTPKSKGLKQNPLRGSKWPSNRCTPYESTPNWKRPRGRNCVQRLDDSLGVIRKLELLGCNSHQLSHFTAFFIDARTKRSIAESCKWAHVMINPYGQLSRVSNNSLRLKR